MSRKNNAVPQPAFLRADAKAHGPRRALALAAVALALGTISGGAMADSWLTQCIEEQGGSTLSDAACYAQYQEKLEAEQADLLTHIRGQLDMQGPEGTDYRAASRSLRLAQKQWLSYVESDCDIVDHTFGRGTALGLAGGSCLIDHYEARNQVLKDQRDFLDGGSTDP